MSDPAPGSEDPGRASAPEVDPLDEDQESWEPPNPALGGPGQLVAAVVLAFVAGVILVGTVAALSWLFRFR